MELAQREKVALGVAIIAHLALFALLSLSWDAPEEPIDNPPMAVDLVAEIAPVSTAPEPATEAPAARRGEIDSDEVEPVPAPPVPKMIPRVQPPPPTPKRAEPVPAPRPAPRAERRPPPPTPRDSSERRRPDRPAATTPPRPANPPATTRSPTRPARDTRPAGDPLGRIVDDVARTGTTNARGTNAPAAQTAAEVRQSITVAVDREIAPFWQRNVPSGVDIEQLRVVLEISLNRDGSVASVRQAGELAGRTESNQPQQARFVEQAIRSVRQAAPFALPEEHYDSWRVVRQSFRARLGN